MKGIARRRRTARHMDHETRAATQYDDARAALSRWRKRTIALLWVTYAAFYLCRVNLAAAQHDLARERGLTKDRLGLLLSLLKGVYAVGQFVNGLLADRIGPRRLIAVGLTGSAVVNAIFAHLVDFRAMAVAWAANGYLQACGWTSVVRTIANWFPSRLRDAASGLIGTSYILGSGFSWLLAGVLTERYGWRYAFWGPAWVCLAVTLVFLVGVRERPQDAGLPGEGDGGNEPGGAVCPRRLGALASPRLWALAAANLALFFGYHGLLDWTPHYLAEVGGVGAAAAAQKAFLMPLGGAIGCLGVTWLARRRGQPLGAVAVAAPLLMLAALVWVFPDLVERAPGAARPGLALMGFLSAGPAALMACSMPANIASFGDAATAAGFVDATGYLGSAASGWVSGAILTRVARVSGQRAAWRSVWRTWPLGMVAAAVMVLIAARPHAPAAEQ